MDTTTKNDTLIIELQKKIAAKKAQIKVNRFEPITNAALSLDDKNYNLHVITFEQACLLLAKIQSYISGFEFHFEQDDLMIGSYKASDWCEDLKSRIQFLGIKQEQERLNILEQELEKRLSEQKKTSLDLERIMNSI